MTRNVAMTTKSLTFAALLLSGCVPYAGYSYNPNVYTYGTHYTPLTQAQSEAYYYGSGAPQSQPPISPEQRASEAQRNRDFNAIVSANDAKWHQWEAIHGTVTNHPMSVQEACQEGPGGPLDDLCVQNYLMSRGYYSHFRRPEGPSL